MFLRKLALCELIDDEHLLLVQLLDVREHAEPWVYAAVVFQFGFHGLELVDDGCVVDHRVFCSKPFVERNLLVGGHAVYALHFVVVRVPRQVALYKVVSKVQQSLDVVLVPGLQAFETADRRKH